LGGQRRVVISGNHGTGRAGRGAGGRVVSIAALVARMLASVCLPVVALVVFKVRNIVGVLLAGVGLVLAGTFVVHCWHGHGRQGGPQTWIWFAEDALELSLRSAMGQLTAQCADHDRYRIL